MKHLTAVLVATLLAPAAAAAQAVDVTGKWDLSIDTPQGSRPAVITITKSGDTLTGTIGGPDGELPADIALKEKAITISFTVQTQNGALPLALSGTVEGNEMKGTMDMAGQGTAAWTARRAAAQNPPPQTQEKPAPTMTGTWLIEAQHSAGMSTPTVTITQTGEKLAGKYVGSYGESELTGNIKGPEFTFTIQIGTEQKVSVVYTGTLDGNTIKGSLTMGEMGEGTFTGKRK